MALSATFTANFASFYDAVDKADAKLKDFGAGADKVGGRLTALGNSFSGVKIIQDATLMVKAVEDIGGASKLTEKELARLGSTTNEAVAKMKALGMDVPKNLQEIADKTKDANKSTTDWMGSLTKIAGAVGIAFSVEAIVNFVGSVFDAASAVKDLSDQWGVSTKFAQQWSAAAKDSGIETETLGKSIQHMTEKLSEASPEYDALLKNIGLSGDALRKMSTEDAYRTLLRSLGDIKDATLQYDLTLGLLGPSAKQVIGGIRDGIYDAADAQDYMADETITRLKDAQKAWGDFKNAIVIFTGDIIASTGQAAESATRSWSNFFKFVYNVGKGTGAQFVLLDQALAAADAQAKRTAASLNATTTATDHVTDAGTGLTAGLRTTAQVQADVRAKTEALKKAEKDRADGLAQLKKDQDAYTQGVIAHETAINDLVDTFDGRQLIQKANLYIEALKQSIPVEQMTAAQQENINKVMLAAIEVYDAAGQSAPQVLYDIWGATVKAEEAVDDFEKRVNAAYLALEKVKGIDLSDLGWQGVTIRPGDLPKPPKPDVDPLKEYTAAIADMSAAFAQFGEVSGGVFGGIMQDLAELLGAMKLAQTGSGNLSKGLSMISQAGLSGASLGNIATGALQIGSAFMAATKGTDKLHSAMNGAALGMSVAGPWGAAIGAAAGLIKGFINAHKEAKEVKNLRNDFITAAGGIEAFNQQASAAGISLNELFGAKKKADLEKAIEAVQAALESQALEEAFVKAQGGLEALTHAAQAADVDLTALFAAKSSDQVKAAIKEIEDALQFQADAYQLAIDTAEKYGFTIEELGPAMARQELDKQAQQLFKDWEVLNSAGIDTVLITEKMSSAVSEYVQHASKMGTEVPEAMRPMLEAMVQSGTLLDENGNAITDLEGSGISFALTMSDGFKKLIDQVEKLTDAISRSLGLAIKNVPDVKVKGEVTWDVAPIPIPAAPRASGGEELQSYQGGTDGFKNFGAGTPVMLHGWEAVVPREDSGAFATVGGAGGGAPAAAMAPTIIVNAQGAFFDTPDSLQRLANKVSDALTAKYSVMGRLRAAV